MRDAGQSRLTLLLWSLVLQAPVVLLQCDRWILSHSAAAAEMCFCCCCCGTGVQPYQCHLSPGMLGQQRPLLAVVVWLLRIALTSKGLNQTAK
jgi:hypothetical protein